MTLCHTTTMHDEYLYSQAFKVWSKGVNSTQGVVTKSKETSNQLQNNQPALPTA